MFISLFFESGRCLVVFDSGNLGGIAGIPLVPLRSAAKSEERKRPGASRAQLIIRFLAGAVIEISRVALTSRVRYNIAEHLA